MKNKLLILLLILSFPVIADDEMLSPEAARKELEKVFTPEEATQIEQAVRKQLLEERKAKLQAQCKDDIKKYRDRLAKNPGSEYNTWKLEKTLKECGKELNKEEYTEESKHLKNKQNRMLNEKSIRQYEK